MKKIFCVFVCAVAFLACTEKDSCAVSFADFKTYLSETFLNPFAKDLGSLLGGGTFDGTDCGFPGVDVNFKFVMIDKPSVEDLILPQNTLVGIPYGQVEVGLPMGIGVLARGFSLSIDSNNVAILGFGAKYKIVEESPVLPAIAVYGTYNFLSNFPDFDASTISINIAVSKGFSPLPVGVYAVAGVDFTTVQSKVAGFTDVKGTATGYRANAGIRISPLPLFYLNGDIGFANGSTSYNAGAGLGF